MAKIGKKSKPKKLDYYEAFQQHIHLALKEAELLQEVTNNFVSASAIEDYLPKVHTLENDADAIARAVYDAILPDFVTPIDREDILALTNDLDELCNSIEEVIQCFYMYDVHIMHKGATEFAEIIVKSCKVLSEALGDFANFKKEHKNILKLLRKVDDLEDQGDALFMTTIRELCTNEQEHTMRVMVWTRIFQVMEECVDVCEGVAEQMNCIMLKHA